MFIQVKTILESYGVSNDKTTESSLLEWYREMLPLLDKCLSEIRAILGNETTIDCKSDCHWCCHQEVEVTLLELAIIIMYLNEFLSLEVQNQIKEQARIWINATTGFSLKEKNTLRLCCPFLINAQCSIYPVRPVTCRGWVSSNSSWCQDLYSRKQVPRQLPVINSYTTASALFQIQLIKLMSAYGYSSTIYDLGLSTLISPNDFSTLHDLEVLLCEEQVSARNSLIQIAISVTS